MTPNLGAAIINSGRAFASFSESLPHPHYEAAEDPATNQDFYRRKHNPVRLLWDENVHAWSQPGDELQVKATWCRPRNPREHAASDRSLVEAVCRRAVVRRRGANRVRHPRASSGNLRHLSRLRRALTAVLISSLN
jgi:hypothetical protein